MGKLIGVQFQQNGKLYYFDTNGFEVKPGTYVIVDTSRGYDLGEVVLGAREIDEETWKGSLKKVIRIATQQDIQHGIENRLKEREAFELCQKKIAEHKLEMKLVSVEYAFDNSKILFFFTANGRVDFRSLVKDLASIFKMRIELRQIGVRDEAKMLGGLGPCGRPICCGTFLDSFQPVSIKMAKEQNLSLNPTKISGVCGRLMCCLKYEQDHYEQTRKRMPKVGREVTTPDGTGPVTDLNIVKETVFVRLTNGDTSEIKEYSLDVIVRNGDEGSRNEPARRENNRERNSEIPAQNLDEANEQKTDEQIGSEKKNVNRQPEEGRKEKNRPKGRKGALGQPVRRENPNRADRETPTPAQEHVKPAQQPAQKTPETPAPAKAAKETPPQKETKQSSPWADALQKAMEAIGEEP